MDAGPQYKLPVIPPPDTAPCTGFSVGDDGDGTKIPKAEECLGDLIRIPGKKFFKHFEIDASNFIPFKHLYLCIQIIL